MPEDDIYYEPMDMGPVDYQPAEASERGPEAEPTADDAVAEEPERPMTFLRKMVEIQRRLKAPKNQFNSFGGYYFRSCEDIQEGLKPLLAEYGVFVGITDEIVFLEGRFYVKATVTAADVETGESITTRAFAREPDNRKGSDQSQVTGSSSSYARKYALNAMFLIDDTKDADVPPERVQKEPPQSGEFTARCKSCGTQYVFSSAEQYNQFIASAQCCPNPHWEVL